MPLSDAERQQRRREKNPERVREVRRLTYRRNREVEIARAQDYQRRESAKHNARQQLLRAIRLGRVVRGSCEVGSDECSGRVEAHHPNYSRPLDVRWLCSLHHARLHRDLRAAA